MKHESGTGIAPVEEIATSGRTTTTLDGFVFVP